MRDTSISTGIVYPDILQKSGFVGDPDISLRRFSDWAFLSLPSLLLAYFFRDLIIFVTKFNCDLKVFVTTFSCDLTVFVTSFTSL